MKLKNCKILILLNFLIFINYAIGLPNYKVDFKNPVEECADSELSKNNNFNNLKIGYWSPCKLQCGLTVYTKHHLNALAKYNCQTFFYHKYDFEELGFENFINKVRSDNLNILNIQYSKYLMIPLINIIEAIKIFKNDGVKIIITVHDEYGDLIKLQSLSDHIIYHKRPHYLSMESKISVLPHGVPVFMPSDTKINLREKYGYLAEHKILTTFGLMFCWKEFPEVLQKLVPLIKKNPDLRIQMLTSISAANENQSEIVACKIQKVIVKNNLQNQVMHITKFLEQQELDERLYISDLGFYWAGKDTLSSTGAGKEFISGRLPLICTDSSHFHDLNEGIVKTPKKLDAFIKAINETLNNNDLLEKLRQEMEIRYQLLNYDNLIKQYLKIYSDLISN